MQRKMKIPYGKIPEWAKKGPISLKNYDYRVEQHNASHSVERGGEHPIISLDSHEFPLWHEYFTSHLGGLPWAMRAVINKEIWSMTVPEKIPQWFDSSFIPNPKYRVQLPKDPEDEYSPHHRQHMVQRFDQLMDDLLNGRLTRDSGEQGRAPEGTIFSNFDEAVRRHGRPNGFFEKGPKPQQKGR
mgnify:CR=1 FL=1